MANEAGPVLLEGPGSSRDAELVRSLIDVAVLDGVDDLVLEHSFTGEVRFTFTARFYRGRLAHVDSALAKHRRRVWRDE